MPVLLKQDENSQIFKVDVDNLVTDVRDRLCLQTEDKLCSQLRLPYNSRHHNNSHHAGRGRGVGKWGQFHDTASSKEPPNFKNVLKQKKAAHMQLPYDRSYCRNQHRNGAHHQETDPHLLLQKLVAEQSLIQEAVRRLKSQKSSIHSAHHDNSDDDSLSQHSVDL